MLNVVKATDSHNQIVIKANEDNVAKLREERLKREDQKYRATREQIEKRREKEKKDHRLPNDLKESRSHRSSGSSSSSSNKRRRDRENQDEERKRHKKKAEKKSSRHHEKHDRKKEIATQQNVQYKGRGKVRINVSSMDKYFSKEYDPLLDVESDKEEYVFATEEKSSKRKHRKKRDKRKYKHRDDPSSSSSSSSEEEVEVNLPPSNSVRAWDVGKV